AAIALFVMAAYWCGVTLLRLRGRAGVLAGIVSLASVVIVLGLATRARNLDYTSEERLWGDTVQKQPRSPRAQLGYGVVLVQQGRWAEAEPHLRAAVALEPQNPLAH